MKNSTKITKQIRKCVFINLVFVIVFATVVYAQNSDEIIISGDDGAYYAQNGEIRMMDKKNQDILPGLGRGLNKIAKKMVDFLAADELFIMNSNNLQGLALTSSFINEQLIGGFKLEFYANPMDGGGALVFKKTF